MASTSLKLREAVAELFVVRASGYLQDAERQYPKWELSNKKLKNLLYEGLGGVILYGGNTSELKERCKTLQKWAKKQLLLCADIEEGLGQRFYGGSWLTPPLSIGEIFKSSPNEAIKLAEIYGRCTARQAKSCGLNWILGPVCDVNNNPENPVINVRAWGEDPKVVSKLISAYLKGLSNQKILSCAKHFPGHGDTNIDSHLELPILNHNINRLNKVELIPFKTAISENVDAVMTAHLLLKQIDKNNPATLSPIINTNILRNTLNFRGLIVTDALLMEAINHKYNSSQAAVMAFSAGADIILMPKNADNAINAICKAIDSGLIPIEKLETSLRRRRKALNKVKETIPEHFFQQKFLYFKKKEAKQDERFAHELISKSLVIHNKFRLRNTNSGINLIRIDSIFSSQCLNKASPSLNLPSLYGYKNMILHNEGISAWQNDLTNPLNLKSLGEGPILLQLFIRGRPFSGKINFKEPWINAVKQLQDINRLSGLIIYGNPYLWDKLLEVIEKHIPCAYSPGEMPEAQHQVLSSLFNNQDNNIHLNESFTD